MSAPKDKLDRANWMQLLYIFIVILVTDAVFAVALLGYSRSSGGINWSLGLTKLGDLVGDLGNLLIAVAVFVIIVALAVITIEELLVKPLRYILYATTILLALLFQDRITEALTGMSGYAIVAIAAFLCIKTIVFFLIKPRKEVA